MNSKHLFGNMIDVKTFSIQNLFSFILIFIRWLKIAATTTTTTIIIIITTTTTTTTTS
jgi:hypothetical protein